MITFIEKRRSTFIYRALSAFIAFAFIFSVIIPPPVDAQIMPQTILNLPVPGSMVTMTPAFTPTMITGVNIYPDNPLKFDFIINRGDSDLNDEAFEDESEKLIKYFMASLTVPEDEMWVNLSPYEKDRIIPEGFGRTEMGRDLLAQDYLLKQLSASLMYPEDELGKKFWDRVYKKAYEQFGTTEIPMNTFNKIWIVPKEAKVYEHAKGAFVISSYLNVMLEEDYLALESNKTSTKHGLGNVSLEDIETISGVSSQVVREVLIPEIEREVNEGATFANLRQIYNSMILAVWYKQALKESVLGQVYVDQNMTKGVDAEDTQVKEKIYRQYIEAFEKGVYNYIKEDYDPATQEVIPRKYFSGGALPYAPETVVVQKKDGGGTVSSPIQGKEGDFKKTTVELEVIAEREASSAIEASESDSEVVITELDAQSQPGKSPTSSPVMGDDAIKEPGEVKGFSHLDAIEFYHKKIAQLQDDRSEMKQELETFYDLIQQNFVDLVDDQQFVKAMQSSLEETFKKNPLITRFHAKDKELAELKEGLEYRKAQLFAELKQDAQPVVGRLQELRDNLILALSDQFSEEQDYKDLIREQIKLLLENTDKLRLAFGGAGTFCSGKTTVADIIAAVVSEENKFWITLPKSFDDFLLEKTDRPDPATEDPLIKFNVKRYIEFVRLVAKNKPAVAPLYDQTAKGQLKYGLDENNLMTLFNGEKELTVEFRENGNILYRVWKVERDKNTGKRGERTKKLKDKIVEPGESAKFFLGSMWIELKNPAGNENIFNISINHKGQTVNKAKHTIESRAEGIFVAMEDKGEDVFLSQESAVEALEIWNPVKPGGDKREIVHFEGMLTLTAFEHFDLSYNVNVSARIRRPRSMMREGTRGRTGPSFEEQHAGTVALRGFTEDPLVDRLNAEAIAKRGPDAAKQTHFQINNRSLAEQIMRNRIYGLLLPKHKILFSRYGINLDEIMEGMRVEGEKALVEWLKEVIADTDIFKHPQPLVKLGERPLEGEEVNERYFSGDMRTIALGRFLLLKFQLSSKNRFGTLNDETEEDLKGLFGRGQGLLAGGQIVDLRGENLTLRFWDRSTTNGFKEEKREVRLKKVLLFDQLPFFEGILNILAQKHDTLSAAVNDDEAAVVKQEGEKFIKDFFRVQKQFWGLGGLDKAPALAWRYGKGLTHGLEAVSGIAPRSFELDEEALRAVDGIVEKEGVSPSTRTEFMRGLMKKESYAGIKYLQELKGYQLRFIGNSVTDEDYLELIPDLFRSYYVERVKRLVPEGRDDLVDKIGFGADWETAGKVERQTLKNRGVSLIPVDYRRIQYVANSLSEHDYKRLVEYFDDFKKIEGLRGNPQLQWLVSYESSLPNNPYDMLYSLVSVFRDELMENKYWLKSMKPFDAEAVYDKTYDKLKTQREEIGEGMPLFLEWQKDAFLKIVKRTAELPLTWEEFRATSSPITPDSTEGKKTFSPVTAEVQKGIESFVGDWNNLDQYPRLILSDLEGTALKKQNVLEKLRPKVRGAIERFLRAGGYFVLVTGGLYTVKDNTGADKVFLEQFPRDIRHRILVITGNGGEKRTFVKSGKKQGDVENLFRKPFSDKQVAEVMQQFKRVKYELGLPDTAIFDDDVGGREDPTRLRLLIGGKKAGGFETKTLRSQELFQKLFVGSELTKNILVRALPDYGVLQMAFSDKFIAAKEGLSWVKDITGNNLLPEYISVWDDEYTEDNTKGSGMARAAGPGALILNFGKSAEISDLDNLNYVGQNEEGALQVLTMVNDKIAEISSSPMMGRERSGIEQMEKGGIDLNPNEMDMQVESDGSGVVMPAAPRMIRDLRNMNIQGFAPVIINVAPVINLPLLLGLTESEDAPYADADSDSQSVPMELGFAIEKNNPVKNSATHCPYRINIVLNNTRNNQKVSTRLCRGEDFINVYPQKKI